MNDRVNLDRCRLPLHVAFLAALLASAAPNMPSLAQGLDSEQAIDTIIGSEVVTDEKDAAADPERIVAAIEATAESTLEIRKRFNLDTVEIMFLPDLANDDAPVASAIEAHADEIDEMRVAIEASAMFYHAIDSRSVMLRDVIAVEFGEGDNVTIFAIGRAPSTP